MLLKYFVSCTTFREKNGSVSRCSSQWLCLCIFYQVKELINEKTKKHGKEAMINNAMLSLNNIQKIISYHVLHDLSYPKLKSLLVKHFLKTSNND